MYKSVIPFEMKSPNRQKQDASKAQSFIIIEMTLSLLSYDGSSLC